MRTRHLTTPKGTGITPAVIAHRGFSAAAPENTLAAFRMAAEAGAAFCELDVRLSADRVPVVIHDTTLTRIAGIRRRVSTMTTEELRGIDAGCWKGPEFAGEQIPTLTDVLEQMHRRVRFVVELKHDGMEREVVSALRRTATSAEETFVLAWNLDSLRLLGLLKPDLQTALQVKWPIRSRGGRVRLFQRVQAAGVSVLSVRRNVADADFVAEAHARGIELLVWTVNEDLEMSAFGALGVAGIMTDHPNRLGRLVMQAQWKECSNSPPGRQRDIDRESGSAVLGP